MTITSIYSSGGGNTTLVVKKVVELLVQHHIEVEMINAIVATPQDLIKTNLTILAAPTYDHGVLHAPMDRLLFSSQDVDLDGYQYAIIGLGDSKYDQEYTCESAKILEAFIEKQGGNIIHKHLLINKSPVNKLDTDITKRTTALLSKIRHGQA